MRKNDLKPIGIIHTPFRDRKGMPIQPAGGRDVTATVEVFEEYRDGLKDLEGFSHIVLLFEFHESQGYDLRVVPFMDKVRRGVFATRAPRRPQSDRALGRQARFDRGRHASYKGHRHP